MEKEVAKNTGGYETDISALRDSVDMEIKSVSDSISSEFDIINKQVSDSVLAELDVRKAQLQEQINSGNISVEDANKILSEESDKYKVEAKKSIDSKKPELAAALNKRVSEINNAYQSSLNELQDKRNIYNKQKQEKEIEEMSPWENIGRAFQNEWTKTKMIPAQSIQVASQLTPEGNEKETRVIIDANGIRLVEQTPAEGQIYNRNQLEELRKEIEPTKQIIKSIKDGDYSGAASAVVGSTVNFAGSMVRALASRGASMGAEMGEPMWESAVKAEAEKTGKTPEEVITEDLEDELTAMSLGAVSVLSERFGVKAFKNVMQKNVFKKAVKDEINKKAPSLLSASLKETGTELFQGGIEKGNEEILKGDDGLYSLEGGSILYNEMKNFIASEEGAETAISTFLGSMMLSGGSKGAMAVYNNINKNPKDITAPSIDEILKDRDNAAASFNELYESGKLSEDDYNSSLNLITTVSEYDSKLSKDNTNRAESIKLMMERDSKAEELSQLDETQQAGVKKEIEDINLELEKLSAQKEETNGKETTEQPTADMQEGKRDSEEVQQEVESQKADIGRRRQEELNSPLQSTSSQKDGAKGKTVASQYEDEFISVVAFEDANGTPSTVISINQGDKDSTKKVVERKTFETLDEAKEYGNNYIKQRSRIYDNHIEKTNARYDAELAELKSNQASEEVQQEDSEAKTEKAPAAETAIPEGKKKAEAYTTEEVVEIGDDRIEEFVASQAEAKAQRSDDALQDTPLTVEGVRKIKADGGKLFMTSDGKSGGYVTKDGYMGGLFKQPKSGRRGAAKVLQEARIKAGGKFFEAFGINQETGEGTTLEQIYIENGFRPVARMTFNPEIAPEGWDGTNLKSRPDNVFFVYDPNGQYEAGDGARIEDYNQAYELAKNQANETKTKPSAGNRLFNEPLKAVKEIADRYYERVFGKPRKEFQGTRELDVERAKRLSDAFEAMKNDPNNPEVRKAYEALAKETIEQYKDFVDAGYVVEINNEEPYANAQEMIDDLRKNKKIKIFSTESGFGDNAITEEQRAENPLLARTQFVDVNGVPMLVNDLFRAIHDFYGHAELGNGFGAIGEENAWNLHARMFSPLARRAMTTETRGQNSWVNFSGANDKIKALRQEARRLREEGAPKEQVQKIVDEIYEIGSFADQKIGLLPEEFSDISESLEKQDALKKKPRVRIRTAKIKLKPEQKINYKVGDDILSGKVVEDLGNEVSVETPSGDTVVIDKKDLSNPPKPKRKRIRTVQDETEGLTQKEQTKQAVEELSDAFIREKKAAVKKIRTSLQEKAKRIFELNKKKKDNRKLLKDFSRDLLDKMNKSGIKSARIKEVKTIINQIGKDVSSDKQLQESVGRIINAIQDLNDLKKIEDYNKKLSDANSKSKSIKRKSKSKTQIATLKNIAKRFSLINPKDVSNIDEYLEFAGELNNALSAPIVKMDGVETKSPINKDKINNYIEEALSENESSSKAKLLDNFSDYADMGAIDGSMTSKEIKEVIDAIEGGKDVPSKNIEAFRQVASRYLSAQQKALKEVIKEAPQNVKSRLRDLSNARLDLLDYKDMVMAIRTINNAIENLDIDNVDLITARATAKENAISFAKGRPKISEISFGKSLMIGDTLKSFSKTLARLYLKGVGSTTLIAEGIFGFEGLVKFIDKSRFFDVLKGYKDSQKYSKKIFDKYNNKFKNVKDFFSKDNVYERGIVAYLGRFKDDSVAEFERRKKLLTETLSDLEKSDFEKYESYLSVYNKVVRDSKNFDEVKSKAEKNNVDAVNFWVDEFSKHFDSMSDVSMAVYNTMLDKENNYLPDTYKRIKGVESKNKDPKQVGSSFLGSFDNIDKSKSGRFNEVVSPKTLAKRRYVDLSFEENMVKSLESILTDINTAKDIQYLSEFIDSDAIRDLFKSTDDYKFLRGRVISLIDNIKQNSIPMDEDSMQASKLVNRIGKTSTGLALVGLGQPIKQFVPVMLNTVINLVGKGFTLPDFKVREGQKKILGESITSFRGLESTANIDNQVNKYLDGRPNLLNKALDKSLKMAIENPDKAAAGISWVSYYTKRLKSQGKEVQFDKLDREASIYADLQVSRQQNVPTKELMGELFTSKQLSTRIVKSIFFPFSGFAFNIKTRIWTDVKALKSKNSTKPEKQMAAKSLVGATTELVAYRILQGAITYMIGYMVNVMLLGEDEEEFKEKQAKTFKRSLLNNGINDVLSPAPPLDKAVAYTFNKKILEPTYEKMNVEEKDRIYAYDKSYGNDLGLLGIPYEKGQKFYKMLDMAADIDDVPLFDAKQYFTDKDIEKRISENDKAVMQVVAPIYGLYLMGLMPREVGSAAEKAMQTIERRSKANNSGSKSSSFLKLPTLKTPKVPKLK